eukprot:TRINITY_DN11646_c0_g1::TRINITY_DN11646_c0_g1_i1::g.17550::m.17550 TRINITY_DN11646_c0_g1::TRINITY_DN11646_c0_g1_i1::g.17550  ORF type:complete len:583 (-),score=49.43,sp/A1L1P9/S47A1_DANRE/31.20/5e-56,MatE/PF01554.13/2.8e-31,MatE/PF01554.13/7.1e-28,MatE/PF01554.13/9.1e+02,Polysacc_synt_C/PF14667.1/8.4e+03,Polysacc_synt_C/PF14667.1/56,Polysacc_synt_C/PF14667.1/8.4e-06,Polysacc_synt_C/PF14667.1/1e+03,Polysacc_synt_C/PF14667.1/0.054,DUF4131/PF13567.1/2.3e+03,DUF4131/PF13567.1/4.7e+02,DUF4131/PF13567
MTSLETPLAPTHSDFTNDIDLTSYRPLEGVSDFAVRKILKEEAKELVALALPMTLINTLTYIHQLVDVIFLGHLGKDELAAAAVGTTWWNGLFYFIIGFASGVDTLCSQAYGAKNYQGMKDSLIRGLIIMSILSIFMFFLILETEQIMYYILRESREISSLSGKFCQGLLPGMWFFMTHQLLQRYLQVIGVLKPGVIIGLIATGINILGNYVFIKYLGFTGSPLATSVTRISQFAMTVIYFRVWLKNDVTYPHFSRQIAVSSMQDRQQVWMLAKLGLSGGIMLLFEVCAFEVTTLFASYLTTVELDAHAVFINLIQFMFCSIPLTLTISASIRVGTLLGANEPERARLVSYLMLGVIVVAMCIISGTFYGTRHYIGRIFTTDQEVIDRVAKLANVGCPSQLFDGIQGVASGIFRGMGKQHLVAVVNLVGFWIVAIPSAAVLTFTSIGSRRVESIWIGIGVGLLCTALLYLLSLTRVNWHREAQDAHDRVSMLHKEQQNKELKALSEVGKKSEEEVGVELLGYLPPPSAKS